MEKMGRDEELESKEERPEIREERSGRMTTIRRGRRFWRTWPAV